MSNLFRSSTPKFTTPAAVAAPAAAAAPEAAPITEVSSGTGTDATGTVEELRKKFRPSKGLGANGTGLGL